MAESRPDIDDTLALLHAWQEFAQHPCWAEWRAALQIDLGVADMQLHQGVEATDTVGFGVARTQYAAITAFMQYPEERVTELKAWIDVLERKESE